MGFDVSLVVVCFGFDDWCLLVALVVRLDLLLWVGGDVWVSLCFPLRFRLVCGAFS